MPIRQRKPTSAGRRFQTVASFDEISKKRPEKGLTVAKRRTSGRNVHGRITSRRRGGGHRRHYRLIDFRRDKDGIPAKVQAIEYDPNRSSRIALLAYRDGEKRYILAPNGLKAGDTVASGPKVEIRPGNALPLSNIPDGTVVHNVELVPGQGGRIARSAGTAVQLMAKEKGYANLRMPSGEIRLVNIRCKATVGQVGNTEHELISAGKAGRNRWKGRRPKVRGVAMNPVDHPLGGGEGKASGGRPASSPWGKVERRTRSKRKTSSKFIVRRREKRKKR
ncbi:MAG TPA: 50S ribosomal protein L2 [Actinomycetota bacterium]|jgi:large subunit ribosomal protein L2|nr:50S ribosomal protein L2 [Actinomycetota bacterium]